MTNLAKRTYEFTVFIGGKFIDFIYHLGKAGAFLIRSILGLAVCGCKMETIFERLNFIGVKSVFIVSLTALFTGMILALQGFYSLNKFGATSLLGPAVALTLVLELGPVLTAIVIVARAGSAITAEIGSMRVTEQIDAIEIMGIDPFTYIIMPNLLAGLIAFPLLTYIFNFVGIFGGYFVAVKLLGLSKGSYFGDIPSYLAMSDVYQGVIKSIVFSIIVLWVCLYLGYYTKGGAKGVSKSTTRAVVYSIVQIFMWDYVLTSIYNHYYG